MIFAKCPAKARRRFVVAACHRCSAHHPQLWLLRFCEHCAFPESFAGSKRNDFRRRLGNDNALDMSCPALQRLALFSGIFMLLIHADDAAETAGNMI